jgi:hypothetical protein
MFSILLNYNGAFTSEGVVLIRVRSQDSRVKRGNGLIEDSEIDLRTGS